MSRYFRLWTALGKYGLIRELTFRGNFLIKLTVEVLWLAVLLIFYRAVFQRMGDSADVNIAGWTEGKYLFYVGCHFALMGVLETLFLENCGQFADLIRTGDLDFFLLKPIDEQFLITCRTIDWSTAPNVLMGGAVMIVALQMEQWEFHLGKVLVFLLLFSCGVGIAYSFLLMLTASSVWLMRNQTLYEIWWLFGTLMRYPRDIFVKSNSPVASNVGWFFTFIIPIMLVTNVPAGYMVMWQEDPFFLFFTLIVTVILLFVSRRVFRSALQHYRSASS